MTIMVIAIAFDARSAKWTSRKNDERDDNEAGRQKKEGEHGARAEDIKKAATGENESATTRELAATR